VGSDSPETPELTGKEEDTLRKLGFSGEKEMREKMLSRQLRTTTTSAFQRNQ